MSCFAFMVLMMFPFSMDAFNFSPYPNLIINSPKNLKFQLKQTRSSYFGYTLVIRPTSIIVGAPRAQSTLYSQRNINETGAIFRCSLDEDYCSPYIVDHQGNVGQRGDLISGRKDFQWLGGSMDGGTLDTDTLLVCAPRFYEPRTDDDFMFGVCYHVQNTVGENPGHVTPISRKMNMGWPNFMREMGLSVHVMEDNSKVLIGAPGENYGRGSVFVYRSTDMRESSSREIRTSSLPDSYNFYFGYAVSSGHFDSAEKSSLHYVITAPQAYQQSGEAYIINSGGKILQTLRGEQMGEYFGYSVLVEDLNGDKLPDWIVSSPMYGTEDFYDNGVIYVFINKGLLSFEKRILPSPVPGNVRFGTTLSRLGDINHDGFNDVAVGAPFAGNGSVFIYLGSEHGLRDVPSQILNSPSWQPSQYGAHMFGHGLSRGSDIDGNGFNDLAVGAPNAEAVFLYRAYPVAQLYASVKAYEHEIRPQQEKLNITACYRLSTTAKEQKVQQQVLAIRIVIDEQLKRATFAQTQIHEIRYRADVGDIEQCRVLEVQVSFTQKDVYKPIGVEMHYDIVQQDINQEKFCETCVAVDPADPKTSTDRIVFNAGCASAVCIADLHVNSPDVGSTFTLGSSSILRLTYEITNVGETAYLPQFNVTSSSKLTFAQVPGYCQVSEDVMMCDLNGGQALAKGETDSVTVSFDVSQLSGRFLNVTAEVFSVGHEKNLKDNKHVNKISLREFTEIDITGKQTNAQIRLENGGKSSEIISHYEIKSHGPSAIEQLTTSLQIPIAFKPVGSTAMGSIINVTSLKVQATYDNQPLNIELLDQDNNQLSEVAEKAKKRELEDGNLGKKLLRRRRYSRVATNATYDLLSEDFKGQLPLNRTIVFSCQDSKTTMCIRAVVQRVNLRPDNSVYLNVSYLVNLDKVNAILIDSWKYFVILTDLELIKKNDPNSSSLAITRKIEPNIITKHLQKILPLWLIFPSIVVGLLVLSVINYAMYKVGFFHRAKKEELRKILKERCSVEEKTEASVL